MRFCSKSFQSGDKFSNRFFIPAVLGRIYNSCGKHLSCKELTNHSECDKNDRI